MAASLSTTPDEGQLVSVRCQQWVVSSVAKSGLPDRPLHPFDGEAQHLATLASVENDGLGEELQIIWEIEPRAVVKDRVAVPDPTGFDPPARLNALQAASAEGFLR